jgi:hypothetical protein
MCAKINSNTLNIDSHSLYQPISPQFTEAGTLMNQGNFASTNTQIGNIPLAVPILNTLGGVLGAGYGLHLSKKGVEQTYTALKCSDSNGALSGVMNTGVGVTFVGASSAMGANGVVGFLPSLGLATTKTAEALIGFFTTAINWLGLTLYSFYIGGAVAALPELREFRNEFQTMMKNPRMSPKTKALEGLYFLKNKLALTDQEKVGLSPELVTKAEQRKWNQFIRFVGLECAEKVERDLPQLFREVQNGNLDNAQNLITEVNRGNFKQMVGQIAMFAAGILGSIGSALAITAIGGYAAFGLFASASALYWLNSVIGDVAYKIIAPSTNISEVCFVPSPAV